MWLSIGRQVWKSGVDDYFSIMRWCVYIKHVEPNANRCEQLQIVSHQTYPFGKDMTELN